MKIKKSGIALDIDETLSNTALHWFSSMIKLFGTPEKLTAKEMIIKYKYTKHVPYWQTKEAQEWLNSQRMSNNMQREIPLIKNSNHSVEKINKIIPIVAYLTVRPNSVEKGTKDWLLKHNFPVAKIICRPDNIAFSDGNKWKAKMLTELYPKVLGIIDDNPELLTFLPTDYKGTIFVYGSEHIETKLNAIPCKDWKTTLEEVQRVFHLEKKEFKQ
ncbi:MAG: hypothetical protein WCW44_03800 [archaeon]|jgi:hypothetical protein